MKKKDKKKELKKKAEKKLKLKWKKPYAGTSVTLVQKAHSPLFR